MKTLPFFFTTVLVLMTGCSSRSSFDAAAHRKEIENWQKQRDTRLRGDQGWLTLCGLFWLKEGENKIGSDSSNAVIFPQGKAPAIAGSLWLEHGTVRLEAAGNSEIKLHDSVITSMKLASDEDPNIDPAILSVRSLTFQVIYRSGQIGVRVKDRQNPLLGSFKGMEYFPIDPKWRFDAKFEPYNPPKILPIATVIGTTENDTCRGAIIFTVDGKELRLEPVMEQGTTDQFFIMFSDETSGKETYGMGRQLYTSLPDKENHLVLDFNKAYNWPCVFTEYATCPIPPRQNHLALRVDAGEKMFHGHE